MSKTDVDRSTPFWYQFGVNIRHLRYFLAIAETLHFGRAAERLGMSQPPLSKRIAELEDAIGAPLFDRNGRQVSLTQVGRQLVPRARAAVEAFDAAVNMTSLNHKMRLRVGFPPDTSRLVVAELLDLCVAEGYEAIIREASTADQVELLSKGDLEIAVLRHPFDVRGLKVFKELRQALGVIVASSHPLSQKEFVSISELNDFPLALFPRDLAPGLHDELVLNCQKSGFCPKEVHYAMRMTAGILFSRSAVTFGPKFHPKLPRLVGDDPDLVWKSIVGEPLYWRTSVVIRRVDHAAFTRRAAERVEAALVRHDLWSLP